MNKTIQIGNLGFSMDDCDLERLFAPYGMVRSAVVSTHFDSGHSTGVGFVEMETEQAGDAAIASLNGKTHCGRPLSVCWSQSEPNPDAGAKVSFNPMNMAEETSHLEPDPEQPGLP